MRILVATDQWFPQRIGGVARVATETAGELARLGHEVDVIAPRGAAGDGAARVHGLLPRSAVPQTLADPLAAWRAARRLREPLPDVLLAHATTVAAGARAGTSAPLVLVFHASAPLELRFDLPRLAAPRSRARGALLPVLSALERSALRNATRVLVLSEFSRSLLAATSSAVAERAVLVGAGVDVSLFTPGDGLEAARQRLGLAGTGHLLVTVRRLEPRMGLEQLVDAVALLRREEPTVRLVVVGDGPLRAGLEAQARARGLADAIQFAGRVPDGALVDWYRAADLFVLPTLAYEGFGLVTAEALACGTPVIATPVGATPELLVPLDRRLLAAGTTAPELVEAIRRGLQLAGDDLRARCRAHALERFDWQRNIGAWEKVLQSAVHDFGRARAVRFRGEIHEGRG